MTEEERRETQVAAVTLKSISKLGYATLITTPIIFMLIHNQNLNMFENVTLLLFFITVILTGLRAWHIYFDSILLKNISAEKFDLSDLDECLYSIFHKKNQNNTLEDRIKSCYNLTRNFFLFFILHLLLFFGIISWNIF